MFLFVIVLSFFSGLRYHTGWDWEAYDYFFDITPGIFSGDPFKYNIFNYEPLFVIIVSFLNQITFPVFLFFSLSTVWLCVASAQKYLGKYICVFFVAYLYYGYFHNFSIIRQGIATGIFLFSIRYIEQERFLKFLTLVIIASLFHQSAIILVFVYWVTIFLDNKINWRLNVIFVLLSIPFVFFPVLTSIDKSFHILDFAGEKINSYIMNEKVAYKAGASLKYVEIVFLVLFLGSDRIRSIGGANFGRYFNFFGILTIIQLFVYSLFNDYSILYERLSVYFEIPQGIFICMIVACFRGHLTKLMIIGFIFLLVFIRYERMIYHSSNEARLANEIGHLERFQNYCSIVDKKACLR